MWGRGVVGPLVRGDQGGRPTLFETDMIDVDDSELTDDDREFLKEWADNLNESVPVLIGRILLAAIEGDQYVEKRPRD